MRVLHVIPRYWPYTGGSERHLQEISERLAADGQDVTVLATDALDLELFWNHNKRRIEQPHDVHGGVAIRRFPVRHLPFPKLSFPGARWLMTRISALPVNASPLLVRMAALAPRVPELARALHTLAGPVDVIHGMNICFESLLYPALQAARRTGAAFVLTPLTHLGEAGDDKVRKYYTMRHQLALIAQSDAVLVQTEVEREYLARRGVPDGIMVKAGVGVNPRDILGGNAERFRSRYAIDGPIVFCLGTTAYDKGTFHLVEAMQQLWQKGSEAKLVLAGPTMDHFVNFLSAQPRDARQRVHVLGFIPEDDKKDLLAAGEVMVMPSRTDSFGIAYLEAWLYGKPVIGAMAGGVPEVIDDGVDGFLVRFGDAKVLAERVETLLADPRRASEMGGRGRQKTLERFTWDHIYPVVRATYERLAQRRASAGLSATEARAASTAVDGC